MNRSFLLILCMVAYMSCAAQKNKFIDENISFAKTQTRQMLKVSPDVTQYPRTTDKSGVIKYTDMYDWTSGFFAGNLWYLFDYSKDAYWKKEAVQWTESLEPLKNFTKHHDLGFMMYCSYGNAYRLTGNAQYKDVLIKSAESLCTRFNPKTGCIKSWNYRRSLDRKSEWFYPVIIDNMMNLELLFFASKASGNSKYRDIAITHAETTLKNHFRPDFSTYHVVNYDSITGAVLNRGAAQGYTDASTWARGQAWAIYGFTMVYRETKKPEFLNAAMKAADFYLNSNLPKDMIPYWDLNVTDSAFKPVWKNVSKQSLLQRDASAAAIVSSALFELSQYAVDKSAIYKNAAKTILESLSKSYKYTSGTNSYFLLKHSLGSFPNNDEIDVPLIYADYYYLEALLRYKNLSDNNKTVLK